MVLANVPSFWFSFRGNMRASFRFYLRENIRMYPRSGFRSGGTSAKIRSQKRAPISSKTKWPGEKGAPRNHPEISPRKLVDFECRFSYDSCGRDRAPFWPFLGEGFWGNIRCPLFSRPLCFTADPKPKNRTNSAKEFSEQFEGVTGHYPLKQGFWGKSHQKVRPKVRRNLCRESSLRYLFLSLIIFDLAREQSQKFKVMNFENLGMKMWWISGGKRSVDFSQENRLKISHRKLHHIIHFKKRNFAPRTHSGRILA